jgi:hypothetical protein
LIESHFDLVRTVQRTFTITMSEDLDLQLVEPPIAFGRIPIAQYCMSGFIVNQGIDGSAWRYARFLNRIDAVR